MDAIGVKTLHALSLMTVVTCVIPVCEAFVLWSKLLTFLK